MIEIGQVLAEAGAVWLGQKRGLSGWGWKHPRASGRGRGGQGCVGGLCDIAPKMSRHTTFPSASTSTSSRSPWTAATASPKRNFLRRTRQQTAASTGTTDGAERTTLGSRGPALSAPTIVPTVDDARP